MHPLLRQPAARLLRPSIPRALPHPSTRAVSTHTIPHQPQPSQATKHQPQTQAQEKGDPRARAEELLASVPELKLGNVRLSSAGAVVLASTALAAGLSQGLYVVTDETVLAGGSVLFFLLIAKLFGKPYAQWAQEKAEESLKIMRDARAEHKLAVQDRLQSITKMDSVVDLTKDLFLLSKETATAEAEALQLRQRVALAAEIKAVLDSWVRFESQQRTEAQQTMAETIIGRVQTQIDEPKFQKAVLDQAILQVESLVKAKAL